MTLSDKLNLINTYKGNIRTSIANKGVEITSATPLSEYAGKIDSISGKQTYSLDLDVSGDDIQIPAGEVNISSVPTIDTSVTMPTEITNIATDTDYLISKNSVDMSTISNWKFVVRCKLFTGTEHSVIALGTSKTNCIAVHLGSNGSKLGGVFLVDGTEVSTYGCSLTNNTIYECTFECSNSSSAKTYTVYQIKDDDTKTLIYQYTLYPNNFSSGDYKIMIGTSLLYGSVMPNEVIYPAYCYLQDTSTNKVLLSCVKE